jgi:hypothetical protein
MLTAKGPFQATRADPSVCSMASAATASAAAAERSGFGEGRLLSAAPRRGEGLNARAYRTRYRAGEARAAAG